MSSSMSSSAYEEIKGAIFQEQAAADEYGRPVDAEHLKDDIDTAATLGDISQEERESLMELLGVREGALVAA
jgi:hypothetical protein